MHDKKSGSNNYLSTSFKKSIEKNFFHWSFKEIREHPELKRLNLTDEEILLNRYEIKKVMQSYQDCGDSKVFCTLLDTHYQLKRNHDNQLVVVSYQCKKQKNFLEIPEEKINEQINKCLRHSDITFDFKEALHVIHDYEGAHPKEMPAIIKRKGIGKVEHLLKNMFCSKDKSGQRHIIYLFHTSLIDMKSIAIKSERLKRIFLDKHFSRENEEHYLANTIKNIPFLAILDFGIEGLGGNYYYYYDVITELLEYRFLHNKITCIFTPLPADLVFNSVIRNSALNKNVSGRENSLVQEAKSIALQNTFKKVFRNREA